MPAASTHTATYEAADARVRINLAGFTSGTTGVQVVRRNLDTSGSALVRAARLIPIATPASDTVQVYDYEFPAGAQVRYDYYQFPDTTAYAVATATAYDVTQTWIKHTTRPYLNRTVRVAGYTPFAHQLRTSTAAPVRSVLPVGVGDVRGGRTFGLAVRAPSTTAAATPEDLDNLLKVGGVLYLHVPSTDTGLPDPGYVMAVAAEEATSGWAQGGGRVYSLTLAEVAPPDADLDGASITWDALVELYADWDAVVADLGSWDEVVALVAAPSEIVVT